MMPHAHIERSIRAATLFALLQGTFSDIHPFCDQIVQSSHDAMHKGLHGDHLVYADGVRVGEEKDDRAGQRTMKASTLGRICCARHVVSYSLGQFIAAIGVTRALGVRPSLGALLVGTSINGLTHYIIDRREPLKRFLRAVGKEGYLAHATVQRRPGVVDEGGPGTALMECDQAAHRAIGVLASLTTAWLATRASDRRGR